MAVPQIFLVFKFAIFNRKSRLGIGDIPQSVGLTLL
jgi:hypothetical protein